MINPEDLYFTDLNALHEDLSRMGNASSPNFSEDRGLRDCQVVDRSGIKMVVANGRGFSAFNRITTLMRPKKNIWRIRKGSALPDETKLVKDLSNPGHYMLAPATDTPLRSMSELWRRWRPILLLQVRCPHKRCKMPNNPAFKANLPEWRTLLDAAQHYRNYFDSTAPQMEDENKELVAYDEIERLDMIIPRLDRELSEHLEQSASHLKP